MKKNILVFFFLYVGNPFIYAGDSFLFYGDELHAGYEEEPYSESDFLLGRGRHPEWKAAVELQRLTSQARKLTVGKAFQPRPGAADCPELAMVKSGANRRLEVLSDLCDVIEKIPSAKFYSGCWPILFSCCCGSIRKRRLISLLDCRCVGYSGKIMQADQLFFTSRKGDVVGFLVGVEKEIEGDIDSFINSLPDDVRVDVATEVYKKP
ncbi:hypothetical protein HN446_02310 [bacterium]|jgi:hypothetical protein|nr:hypothetical protein [bacterium]